MSKTDEAVRSLMRARRLSAADALAFHKASVLDGPTGMMHKLVALGVPTAAVRVYFVNSLGKILTDSLSDSHINMICGSSNILPHGNPSP